MPELVCSAFPWNRGESNLLPYFPFKDDTYKMAMGVQALDSGCLIEIDEEHYLVEQARQQFAAR